MAKIWVGVDIGKEHHHIAAVNADGRMVYSRRVANDERALLAAMAEVSTAGRVVCWAVDVTNSLAALVLALLWRRQVEVRYVSGTVAFHMAAAFAGENKTDAADAAVIAHTIRMRPDIPGMGAQLTAELLVFTDNMTEHTSAAKLAAHAGLAAVSKDSEAVAGNHRGARRSHRGLRRIFWMSAFTALSHCAASRTYYDRKRAEGRDHRHAILALARRRVDVLWALVRDLKPYAPPAPRPA